MTDTTSGVPQADQPTLVDMMAEPSKPRPPLTVTRGGRIAAVLLATTLLMATTAVGMTSVMQAVSASGSVATSSEQVVDITSVLPAVDTSPALPSIKKILKKAESPAVSVATTPAAPAAITPAVTTSHADEGSGEKNEGESGD